jgi:hypothetical protein
MRRLIDAIPRRPFYKVRVSASIKADLRLWLAFIDTWNGRAKWRDARDPFAMATDASFDGFGARVERRPPQCAAQLPALFGVWSTAHGQMVTRDRSTTWTELFTVVFAVAFFAPIFRDGVVDLLVDSLNTVQIINRQTTRLPHLLVLLRALACIATDYNICLRARHRPAEENDVADFLSRPQRHRGAPALHFTRECGAESGVLGPVRLVRSSTLVLKELNGVEQQSPPLYVCTDAWH